MYVVMTLPTNPKHHKHHPRCIAPQESGSYTLNDATIVLKPPIYTADERLIGDMLVRHCIHYKSSEVCRIYSRVSVDAAHDDVSTNMGEYKPSKIDVPSAAVGSHQQIKKFETAISPKV